MRRFQMLAEIGRGPAPVDMESVFRGEISQPRFEPDIVCKTPWANR